MWYIHKKYQIEEPGSYKLDIVANYELTNSYLCEIFPGTTYDDSSLEQLANVSEKFYRELYQPVQGHIADFEMWQKKDRRFKRFSFGNIVVCSVFLIVTLFFGSCLCGYTIKSFAVISLILLGVTVRRMMRIEKFSNNIFL